jgi:hypothetical protein
VGIWGLVEIIPTNPHQNSSTKQALKVYQGSHTKSTIYFLFAAPLMLQQILRLLQLAIYPVKKEEETRS